MKILELTGGYEIHYRTDDKMFTLMLGDERLGSSEKQQPLEDKAKRLQKTKKNFTKIPCIQIDRNGGSIGKGNVTSIDKESNSMWISLDESESSFNESKRKKVDLTMRSSYGAKYYEVTPNNESAIEQIKSLNSSIHSIEKKIEGIVRTMGNPIDGAYFEKGTS